MSTPRSLQLPPGTIATTRNGLALLELGVGTPCVLVPGYTGSKEDFLPLLAPLGARHRVLAYDQRGQHESTGGDDPGAYTVDRLAEDLLTVIGTEPAHVVGHSFGGLVARAAAIREPRLFRSLTLLDSGPAAIPGQRAERIRLGRPVLLDGGLTAVWQLMDHAGQSPEVAEFSRRRFFGNSPLALLVMGDALLGEPDRTEQLRRTGVPVLVAYGENDDAWPPAAQAQMAARLGAATRVIAGAVHSPNVEQSAATVGILLAFWAANQAGSDVQPITIDEQAARSPGLPPRFGQNGGVTEPVTPPSEPIAEIHAEPDAAPEPAEVAVVAEPGELPTEPIVEAATEPLVEAATEPVVQAATEPVVQAAAAVVAPRPVPGPRPVAPTPPVAAQPVTPTPTPAEQEAAAADLAELSRYGRVADDGTVYLTTPDGERSIGSFVGDAAAAMVHFGRRYDELMTRARLVRDRLAAGTTPPEQAVKAANEIRASLPTADVLGDLPAVEAVLAEVDGLLAQRKAERAQARVAATAVRRRLVEEAEKLVESTSWNATGDRFKAIVEEWTAAGHGDRRDEDALWKRLSAARAGFGEKRRQAFIERDRERDAARQRKEQLIREAEALSSSSEWTDTARKYRDLMDRWKAAGRAPKAEDDVLWNRFRTAQDAFFARRAETFSARDAEFATNQKAKEVLLERAERIDPRSDLTGAQALLRAIQAEWEAVGKVPREVMDSFESRLEAVEDRVREASDSRWQRQPTQETGMIGQLRRGVAELEDKLARAQARGDAKAAKAAEAELASKRMFLSMAEQAR